MNYNNSNAENNRIILNDNPITKEDQDDNFKAEFKQLIIKQHTPEVQAQRLKNLIIGKERKLKYSPTELQSMSPRTLPKIWLITIANLYESNDQIFGAFLTDMRIVNSRNHCDIMVFTMQDLLIVLEEPNIKLSLKILCEIYSSVMYYNTEKDIQNQAIEKFNTYIMNTKNQDFLCKESDDVNIDNIIKFVKYVTDQCNTPNKFTQFVIWRIKLAIKSDMDCFTRLLEACISPDGAITSRLELFVESLYNKFVKRGKMSVDDFAKKEHKKLPEIIKPQFMR